MIQLQASYSYTVIKASCISKAHAPLYYNYLARYCMSLPYKANSQLDCVSHRYVGSHAIWFSSFGCSYYSLHHIQIPCLCCAIWLSYIYIYIKGLQQLLMYFAINWTKVSQLATQQLYVYIYISAATNSGQLRIATLYTVSIYIHARYRKSIASQKAIWLHTRTYASSA